MSRETHDNAGKDGSPRVHYLVSQDDDVTDENIGEGSMSLDETIEASETAGTDDTLSTAVPIEYAVEEFQRRQWRMINIVNSHTEAIIRVETEVAEFTRRERVAADTLELTVSTQRHLCERIAHLERELAELQARSSRPAAPTRDELLPAWRARRTTHSRKFTGAQGVRANAWRSVAAATGSSSDGRTGASRRLSAAESTRSHQKQQQQQQQPPRPLPFRTERTTPALMPPRRAQTTAATSSIGRSVTTASKAPAPVGRASRNQTADGREIHPPCNIKAHNDTTEQKP